MRINSMRYVSLIMVFVTTLFLIACGGGSKNAAVNNNYENIDSLVITSSIDTIPSGFSSRVSATLYYGNEQSADVTDEVTWRSSDENVAAFESDGFLKAKAAGDVSVYASIQGIDSNNLDVTTNNETLSEIQLTPSDIDVPLSAGFTYSAMGTFSDGSVINVTQDIDWEFGVSQPNNQSSNGIRSLNKDSNTRSESDVLTVDKFGNVSADAPGAVAVTARSGDVSSNIADIAVKEVTLTEIQLTPGMPNIAAGTYEQFSAVGFYDDNTSFDLTDVVSWSSSDTEVGTISDTGKFTAISNGSTTVNASFNNVNSSAPTTVADITLLTIQVTPDRESFSLRSAQQFQAIAVFSNDTSKDVSSDVTWKSGDPEKLSMTIDGFGITRSVGDVTVFALLNGIVGSATISINNTTLDRIQVTPGTVDMWDKAEERFTAMGYYSDGTTHDITETVSWRSTDSSKATIVNGKAVAKETGDTEVFAYKMGVTSNDAKVKVNVGVLDSIHLTPANLSLPINSVEQAHASGHYSDDLNHDITNTVSWRSSNRQVATVSKTGEIRAINVGVADITAYKQGIISHRMTIDVVNADLEEIQITPSNTTISPGVKLVLHAIGHYADGSFHDITSMVTWHSSNHEVAKILPNGKTHGLGLGSTNIFASLGDFDSETTILTVAQSTLSSIQLTHPKESLIVGGSQEFHAIGYYGDGSNHDVSETAAWASTNPSVATISDKGIVHGLSTGDSVILAWKDGIKSTEVSLSVTELTLDEIQVTPALKTLAVGSEFQFQAKGKYDTGRTEDITSVTDWRSSNPSVASVTSDGIVHAIAPGVVRIQGRKQGALSNIANLTVSSEELTELKLNRSSLELSVGSTFQLQARAIYADGHYQDVTDQLSWRVADSSIARIGANAVIEGLASGQTNIVARKGNLTKNISVSVSGGNLDRIEFSGDNVTLVAGSDHTLSVTGYLDSGTEVIDPEYFTWRSSDFNVATVSELGIIQAHEPGTATITAAKGTVTSGDYNVTVGAGTLQSIKVTPTTKMVDVNSTFQYTAQGVYEDANGVRRVADITSLVNWSSDDINVATLSTEGEAHSIAFGTANITAILGMTSNSSTLSVVNTQVQSIRLVNKAGNNQLSEGSRRRLHAEAVLTDNTVVNIGERAIWSIDENKLMEVEDEVGVFEALTNLGSTTITITHQGHSASANLDIVAEGTNACATPSITADVRTSSAANASYVSKTFHCPVNSYQNAFNYIPYDSDFSRLYGPYKTPLAVIMPTDLAAACQARSLEDIHSQSFIDLMTYLGYDDGRYFNYDYGWSIFYAFGGKNYDSLTMQSYTGNLWASANTSFPISIFCVSP